MVEFCAKDLMPRLAPKLDIRVELSGSVKRNQGNLGCCYDIDPDYRPRAFVIEADSSQSLRMLLITIAHEMVHVKQMARCEQQYTKVYHKVKWMGKTVDLNKTNYWELPWEIEAHGRETGLFLKWCEANGLEQRAWTHDKNIK